MVALPRPDLNRRWSLANVVYFTYTLFLAGFFVVPNAVDLYKFYILMVFFPGLFLLPGTLKLCWRSPIWCSVIAYLVYMLLSSFWSHQFSLAIFWRDVLYAVYILSFILLTVYFFTRNQELPNTAIYLVALVVIVAAIFSIVSFEPLTQLPNLTEARLSGVGALGTVNESAFVYGIFGVIALDYVRRNRGQGLAYLYATGFAIIVLFVILTQSNTGLLALSLRFAISLPCKAQSTRSLYWPTFSPCRLSLFGLVFGAAQRDDGYWFYNALADLGSCHKTMAIRAGIWARLPNSTGGNRDAKWR